MLNESLIYLPTIIGLLTVGIFVLVRSDQLSYRLYGLFSGTLGIFVALQYLSNANIGPGKLWLQLTFLLAFFLAASGVAFVNSFPYNYHLNKISYLLLGLPIIIFAPLSFTSLLVKSYRYIPKEGVIFQPGILYSIQTLVFVLYLLSGLIILFSRLSKMSTQQRAQTYILLFGFVIAVIGNVLAGYVFSSSSFWQMAGPLSIFIMVCLIAYAIIRHRLFDIRLAVTRSVAYLLSLGLIGILYGIFIFVLSSLAFFSAQGVFAQRIEYIGFTLIMALSFPRVKSIFDRITNRIFYRDAYDPQLLIDDINKALVANTDLNNLLTICSEIIAENFKAEYCLFIVNQADSNSNSVIGTDKRNFNQEIIADLKRTTLPDSNVLVTDYLPPESNKLKHSMVNNKAAILVRLFPELSHRSRASSDLGYIIMGNKRSGNSYTSEDVNILSIIANGLVIGIQNALHFEEIQRFNDTLQEKVDDATRRLKRANQRLEELDETKDDFISMASHQLRTPLTSVKGYLSMVLEGDAGKLNSTQVQMLHQAFASSQRMVFLITDLLNVSRLKTGKFVIDPTAVDLGQLVEEEVSQLVETAQVHSIKLSYKRPPAFPKLMLDETKTRQVIMNFIDNAIYYTPAGGHIDVQLEDKPSTIELRVVDDGIGVPKSEQHHLFTKFYRAGNARKVRPDGTGLGLFMAKKVVTAQGGSILFSSEEGKGSSFGFVIAKDRLKLPDSINPQDQTVTHISTAPGTVKPATKKKMASVR